jgi:hypothetical protein
MMFVPLNRDVPDPGFSSLFYLNIDQALSITRSADDTHTRIRGLAVYLTGTAPTIVETLVLETPEEIAALINAAKAGVRMIVRKQ